MAVWREQDFLKAAKQLVADSISANLPIADMAVKVSQQHNLNPEQIRTLVKMSNVAAFQKHYAGKEGDDRSVEFDTADPEEVIAKISELTEVAPSCEEKVASYDTTLDYSDMPWAETEKVAEESAYVEPEKVYRRDQSIMKLRKVAEELEIRKAAAQYRWDYALDKVAWWVRKQDTTGVLAPLVEFEKCAVSVYGTEVEPELLGLRVLLKQAQDLSVLQQAGFLQERFVVESNEGLNFLKEAVEARNDYEKIKHGLSKLSNASATTA